MSREIKFRVWSEEDKEYRKDCLLLKLFNCVTGLFATIFNDEGDRFDIEQYTGLKDKNGKEIYEGDIVEWVNGLGEKHIFEIMWNECRASFQMIEIGQEYPYILQGLSDKMKPYCEVIGNIHENPELLGGEE